MAIVQYGTLNTATQIVPGVDVTIVPPQIASVNGVSSNRIGVVGTATYGPVNQPVTVGSMAEYEANFGPMQPRAFDMGTPVAAAILQGAADFTCVRVSDGTETAAAKNLKDSNAAVTGITATAYWPGSLGNNISVNFAQGSKANSVCATISMPGYATEAFNNIGTANAAGQANAVTFWGNFVNAINTGTTNGNARNPKIGSLLIKASGTVANTAMLPAFTGNYASQNLTGGTDGDISGSDVGTASGILVGTDGTTRTGMYALRDTPVSIGILANANRSVWPTMAAFGENEGIYFVVAGPSGETIAAAASAKNVDSYAMKVLLGDYLYWADPRNGVVRLVSPAGFVAGRLANLAPNQSSLNKKVQGVLGSLKVGAPGTGTQNRYTNADIELLATAGIDVLTTPIQAGNQWGCFLGVNSSSDDNLREDSYTRMTNYIALSLNKAMGAYIGRTITPALFRNVHASMDSFLNRMLKQGLLAKNGRKLPYSVVCDESNNPSNRTSLGYLQCDVQVIYESIVRYFNISVEGGQTVTLSVKR